VGIILVENEKNKNNYKLDKVFFNRLFNLAKPFWLSSESRKCRYLLILSFIIPVIYTASGGYFSFKTAEMTNALVAKNENLYWSLLIWITGLGGLRSFCLVLSSYISNIVNLNWRIWLTQHLFSIYLTDRTYYRITLDDSVDNPDQRIQEEIAPFCQVMSGLPGIFFSRTLDMFLQGYILLGISRAMFFTVIIYAVINTVVTLILFRPFIKQQYDVTVSEANLRYSLLQVKDNVENIAFYNGEKFSRKTILEKLSLVVVFFKRQYNYTLKANTGFIALNIIWLILPIVIITPLYFSGKIEYGVIAQATTSSAMLLASLSIIQRYIPEFTSAAPGIIRLAEIQEKMAQVHSETHKDNNSSEPKIRYRNGESLSINDLCLTTPGGEQLLVQHLNLMIKPGEHLIIVGRTGTGKSSLLRAISGLWFRGSGTVSVPEQRLFLPQRPYFGQDGQFRNQLIYPLQSVDISDEDLMEILDKVNLREVCEKYGGLDSIHPWRTTLSLGEQQRVGIARVLISRPRYVFLDEATSAVDESTQEKLYQNLLASGVTVISVGHRPSIIRYHEQVLHLLPQGKWELFSTQDSICNQLFDI
jgi:putative ATP-binding cassette transporter